MNVLCNCVDELGNKTRRQRLVEVGVRQLHDEIVLLYIDYIQNKMSYHDEEYTT